MGSAQGALSSAHLLPVHLSGCLRLGPQQAEQHPDKCMGVHSPACLLPAGRWKGTMVAVKVVETHVGEDQCYDLHNEPLLRCGAPHSLVLP